MSALITLAILVQAVLHRSGSGNESAIRAFKQACVGGALNLSAAHGTVLRNREITDFVRMPDWGRPKARRTVVKLNNARSSYIVITEYKNLQPRSIAKSCALVSSDVSKEEASTAYLENLPDKVVIPKSWPPQWTSDHPELGYSKHFRIRSDGSIVLEVDMYPGAAAQISTGNSKQ